MSTPRLRIFAGPNGSGKSTLFESFSNNYDAGIFVNADLLEKELATKGFVDLNEFNVDLNKNDLDTFLNTEDSKSLIAKSGEINHKVNLNISHNIIVDRSRSSQSYEGALISSLIRSKILEKKVDYSFETVMSHYSKIQDIYKAKKIGYKTYLYFICIDDPEINISRVENRVQKGGHPVDSKKIVERYYRTLKNLISAIEVCDKTYLFDNSGNKLIMIAKISNKKLKLMVNPEELPNWFLEHVLSYYAV